ncbi:MAG: HAMP domain-containing sensor histidine kinase [Scrofimicrobium sp.]
MSERGASTQEDALQEAPQRTGGLVAAQRAPVKVGLAVAAASSVVMLLLAGTLIWVIWRLSRLLPNTPDGGRDGHRGRGIDRYWEGRIVDLDDVVPLMVVLAVIAVILISLIAWWVTKRANAPLQRALEIQQAFVADASHELRTPLTTLNGRIQLAQHRLSRGGDVEGALVDARADAEVMNDILTDLLTAAETAAVGSPVTYTNLSDAVATAMHLTQTQADEAQVVLQQQIPSNLEVRGEKTALTRALVALIDNALRHSPPGTTVTVDALGRKDGFAEVRIIDQGVGITAQDPERLFERFARESQGSDRRGFGLGLALVRDIAERFGGTVMVEKTSPEGTTFLLRLPTNR